MTLAILQLDASDGDNEIATGGSHPIALVEGGDPPTEYLMFAAGVNDTVKGPLLFDDEAAAAVLAFYEARGRKRLAGDWEHDSMVPPEQRPSPFLGCPASHWFDLEVRPGPELWATAIKWTETAFGQIKRGEYAHTSPVVKFQKKTMRVVAVLSSALTNDPATIGQPQLVAASAETMKPPPAGTPKDQTMPMWKMDADDNAKIKGIADGEHADEKEMCGKLKACLSEAFPDHFGEKQMSAPDLDPAADAAAKLAEDMGKEEGAAKMAAATSPAQQAAMHIKSGNSHDGKGDTPIKSKYLGAVDDDTKRAMTAGTAAIVRLQNAVATFTGVRGVDRQIGALTAMKAQSEEVAQLSARAAKVDSAAFDAIVSKAHAAKKFTPADIAAGSKTKNGALLAEWRSKGDEGIAMLSGYVETLSARVITAETQQSNTAPSVDLVPNVDAATLQLTATEKESCRKNGTDPAEYLKNKRARHAAGDAPRF